jgi:hypothetical protein
LEAGDSSATDYFPSAVSISACSSGALIVTTGVVINYLLVSALRKDGGPIDVALIALVTV